MFFFFNHFRKFRWLFKYRTTQWPTQFFSQFKITYSLTYSRCFVLVLGTWGIEILIRNFRNSRKMLKLWQMAILLYLLGSPWQRRTCKQNPEHSFGNYGILPLLCKCKPYKINNFKFSENLRPKRPLINPGPNLLEQCYFHNKKSD